MSQLEKQIANELIEFKTWVKPKDREKRCPFRIYSDCCRRCRIVFPLLVKKAPALVSQLGHSCPCVTYSISYVKKVVRNFIRKWR